MHIIGDTQDAQPCVDCIKSGRVRLVRRLYGLENEALCRWCHADRSNARNITAAITMHDGRPQAIDAWEPGEPV